MTALKTPYLVVVLLFIIVSNCIVQLAADEVTDEEKQAVFQEFINMADEFEKQNKINEAIDIYERILKTDSENVELNTKLAALYTRTSQHEQAAEIWNKLLDADPENPNYHDSLCNSLQAAGKLDEAIEIVQSFIEMSPDDGIHYARLAKLYADSENEEAAIKNYEKATELEYGEKDLHLKFAEIYFLKDDVEGSENALKNAVLSATSDWDRQNIEKRLINLYRIQGNLDQKLQNAEAEGNISIELQKAIGEMHLRNGEFAKAGEALW